MCQGIMHATTIRSNQEALLVAKWLAAVPFHMKRVVSFLTCIRAIIFHFYNTEVALWGGAYSSIVEHLPSISKALSSIPSTTKKETKLQKCSNFDLVLNKTSK